MHRTLTFAQRFAEGRVPPLRNPRPVDEEVLRELATFPERIGSAYEQFRFREAVQETMNLARLGNKYFNDTEPWHTRKTDPQACANTIHVSLQICAALGILMEPVLPFAAARLREMLRLEGVRPSTPDGEGELGWDDAARPLLPEGHEIGRPEILFTKIEDEVIGRQIARLEARAQQAAAKTDGPPYAPLKPEIVYDDFDRLDLRVGRVEKAERVSKSKKLLRLEVDLGFEKRQILAGVAEQMAPEDLEGRRVVVVANLKPRKMMGLESQGMLLMAEDREGRLVPVTAESEPGAWCGEKVHAGQRIEKGAGQGRPAPFV
nr:methionine--tRNA ligase subunit beta [Rhodothermus marinus]